MEKLPVLIDTVYCVKWDVKPKLSRSFVWVVVVWMNVKVEEEHVCRRLLCAHPAVCHAASNSYPLLLRLRRSQPWHRCMDMLHSRLLFTWHITCVYLDLMCTGDLCKSLIARTVVARYGNLLPRYHSGNCVPTGMEVCFSTKNVYQWQRGDTDYNHTLPRTSLLTPVMGH